MGCPRCHKEMDSYLEGGHKICVSCLSGWSNMRQEISIYLKRRLGKMSPLNLDTYKRETKRLEKLWRAGDPAYEKEIH